MSTINAKEELQRVIDGVKESSGSPAVIQYAEVWTQQYDGSIPTEHTLYSGHTQEELAAFWDWFDFNYDDGFGSQILCGYVVFNKGRWLERREYDGSEWWDYVKKPKAPKRLKAK